MRYLGPHACEEALSRGELHSLWVAPAAFGRVAKLISEARAAGVVIHRDPMESLDRRSQGQRHQGVLGEGTAFAYTDFEDVVARLKVKGDAALVLALDGVTDPILWNQILFQALSMPFLQPV